MLTWMDGQTVFVSVVFTWNLPTVRKLATLYRDRRVVVGGPAVESLPQFLADLPNVSIGEPIPGMMQRYNPMATITMEGCIRRCGFCSAWRRRPFRELQDWPDLPLICDNNLLACSQAHFDRVIDRLKVHGWADFNQGLDCRLLTEYHAARIREIKKPVVRLALDHSKLKDVWLSAVEKLLAVKVPKRSIRSYVIIAENTGPDDAWDRCRFIESHGPRACPMWYHPENAMKYNAITPEQRALGWNDFERRRIMRFYYHHAEVTA